MSAPIQVFDVNTAPLCGVLAIEASAGTGKTWNLCRLYRRLITEAGYAVSEILVVTYTEAATAELKERIWQHLGEALAATTEDPARQRLEQAIAAFDEAAIFTIHGFCQRALSRLAFLAGRPLGIEEVIDAREMAGSVVAEFWRQKVLTLIGDEARFVLERGPGPEQLLDALLAITGQPLAKPKYLTPAPNFDPQAFAKQLSATAALWQAHHAVALASIDQALQERRLNGVKYKADTVARAAAAWQAIFAGRLPSDKEIETAAKLGTAALCAGANKGQLPPKHPLFEALEEFLPWLTARQRFLHTLPGRLFQKLAEEGPALLAQEKARARALSFDDMLWRLYEGVAGPDARPELIAAVRGVFRCALIDEFQDTDPLQLAIFKALYASAEARRGPLFLIGDPKQAIYSFRGADLHSYFAGRALADRCYALNDNQRSSDAMIGALNRLFSGHTQAFRIAELQFTPAGKGQKPIPPLIDDSGLARPALAVWSLDEISAEGTLDKAGVKQRLAQLTASEIARLLVAARAGQLRYGERPVQPRDIAVLVRTHAQGALIAEALAGLGITAVRHDERDVFQSFEAGEMLTVLTACAEPRRLTLLRAALCTVLLGANSQELARLNEDQPAFDRFIECFTRYHQIWCEQGFGPMWRRLSSEQGMIERLLKLPGGERRATNLLHLAELAAEASCQLEGPQALLQWLTSQGRGGSGEARQLRLESDDNLVQIVTKHRSKGLEYPIVFCPFLWDDGKAGSWSGLFQRYHDDQGQLILDFAPDDQANSRAQEEQRAERLRLIYVALTRAVHRCYIAAGVRRMLSRGKLTDCEVDSMLNWLVAGSDGDWAQAERVRNSWQNLMAAGDGQIGYLDRAESLTDIPFTPPPAIQCAARSAPTALPLPSWVLASFSSLTRGLSFESVNDTPGADYDHHPAPNTAMPVETIADDILHFARGPAAGDCIHQLFESIDFTDVETWPAAAQRALHTHLPDSAAAQGSRALLAMLHNVTQRALLPGLRLGALPASRRLIEMEFYLPLRRLDGADFWRLLERHGFPGRRVAFPVLQGFLRGRIDLIFEHDGLWYVLDWKSNHLGDRPADYALPALQAAMCEHAYDLQALIYLVALHRYLRLRMGRAYDPERQLGGALYLFVRGVRPTWPEAGVWHWRPPVALLDELSSLLD